MGVIFPHDGLNAIWSPFWILFGADYGSGCFWCRLWLWIFLGVDYGSGFSVSAMVLDFLGVNYGSGFSVPAMVLDFLGVGYGSGLCWCRL